MLFKVRLKHSSETLEVYSIKVEGGAIQFLVYGATAQNWGYLLADNCVPAL